MSEVDQGNMDKKKKETQIWAVAVSPWCMGANQHAAVHICCCASGKRTAFRAVLPDTNTMVISLTRIL